MTGAGDVIGTASDESGAKYGRANAVNVDRQVAGEVRFVDKWGTNEHAVIWTLP